MLLACGGATTSENSILAASSEREGAESQRTAQGGLPAEPERRTETGPDDKVFFGLGNFLMPEDWPVLDIPDRGSLDTGHQNACPRQPVGIASLLESLLDDLATLEADQRSFTRYVFSFEIYGEVIPATLRIHTTDASVAPEEQNYCQFIAGFDGAEPVLNLSEFRENCWAPGGEALPTPLSTLSWAIPVDPFVPVPFDFCVSEIRPHF